MGIKSFHYVALLNFTNAIGPHGSNSDIKSFHGGLMLKKKMHPSFYCHSFHNVSIWENVFLGPSASRDVVIPWLGYYVKWASYPGIKTCLHYPEY